MSVENIKNNIPDFAKDVRLNIGKLLGEEGVLGLSNEQVAGIALASAYSTKNEELISNLEAEYKEKVPVEQITAAKAAASIMAMNNVYYRFVHLVSDKEYGKLPAGLRMNVIGNPGVPKVDFELYSLAVSAINGCGMCMDSHVHEVIKAGITKDGVQATIKIAAVINSVAQSLTIKA